MKIYSYTFFAQLLMGAMLCSLACSAAPSERQTDQPAEEVQAGLDQLPANQAGELIRKSIATAGGWDNWMDKQTISYQKHMTFYDSAGNVDRELKQLHQYQLHPQFKARISWEQEGDQFVIINNGQQAWKYINGALATDQASINQAWNSSFGSHYVMFMPFKLADPGVVATYMGLDTLENEAVAEVVKITYKAGAGSAAGMHSWYYMFDPETAELIANFLDHGQGYSLTTYEEWQAVKGLQMPVHRISYSTDSLRNPQSGKTIYRHQDLVFDVPMAADLFEPPQG